MNPTNTMPPAQSGRRKLRNDVIFVALLLAVVLLAGVILLLLQKDGNTVTVTVDGVLFGTYPLSEDRTVEIRTGREGEELNLLVIRDGRAHVENATCPDGICAAHKPISKDGESIICLPHKVVVEVKAADPHAPDVVA